LNLVSICDLLTFPRSNRHLRR